jgi:mono/diheme cytochrome c family protein
MRRLALDCGGHFKIMAKRKKTIGLGALLLVCGVLGWLALAEEQPKPVKNSIPPIAFPADGKVDFEKHVQPIFVGACYECHGAKKMKGKLRLDSKELAMKGGTNGVGIVQGKGKDSYLVKRLRGLGDEDRMPLDHDPLTEEQIKIIETWIDQGAVWPDRASVKVENLNLEDIFLEMHNE